MSSKKVSTLCSSAKGLITKKWAKISVSSFSGNEFRKPDIQQGISEMSRDKRPSCVPTLQTLFTAFLLAREKISGDMRITLTLSKWAIWNTRASKIDYVIICLPFTSPFSQILFACSLINSTKRFIFILGSLIKGQFHVLDREVLSALGFTERQFDDSNQPISFRVKSSPTKIVPGQMPAKESRTFPNREKLHSLMLSTIECEQKKRTLDMIFVFVGRTSPFITKDIVRMYVTWTTLNCEELLINGTSAKERTEKRGPFVKLAFNQQSPTILFYKKIHYQCDQTLIKGKICQLASLQSFRSKSDEANLEAFFVTFIKLLTIKEPQIAGEQALIIHLQQTIFIKLISNAILLICPKGFLAVLLLQVLLRYSIFAVFSLFD